MIAPYCKGVELQQQIHTSKAQASLNSFDLWWLGQSGFLIQWSGKCLLLDPYLSDSLTKKYATTNKPHVRMSELVIDPQLLDCIDVITVSHNHTDHLDGETLIPLLHINRLVQLVIPEANRSFVAERIKCAPDLPIGLNAGEKVKLHDFTIHGVPSAHNTIERDEIGQCKFMGYVIQFGKWSIYHSGDTLWYEGMVELLKPFKLDIAFLPINGNDPLRGVAGNLDAREAAQLGKEVGARLVIPHHYHMFEFNTEDPGKFVSEAERVGQSFRVLKLGEHFTFA